MTKINLLQPEYNRTGTGNIFNLKMPMIVIPEELTQSERAQHI